MPTTRKPQVDSKTTSYQQPVSGAGRLHNQRPKRLAEGRSSRGYLFASLAAVLLVAAVPADARSRSNATGPRSPFDCATSLGKNRYGSTERCLQEMCKGQNVYNEYLFSNAQHHRNPCYRRKPTRAEE